MNAFVITCIALAVITTAVALISLCYAALSAKDGYEDESGFHGSERIPVKSAHPARPGLARRVSPLS